jgi:hypothetical protein
LGVSVRQVALVACLAACAGACGASGGDGTTSTSGQTRVTTVSAARVGAVGAVHVPRARRAIAAVDRSCGGRSRIRPATAALARRCDAALTALAAEAHAFARALVYLRAPMDLEPLIADTIDEAKPIIDIVDGYPRAQCLSPSATRGAACVSAARDLGTVIDSFEHVLDSWPAGAGAS